ncbi:hypothetical protein FB451DRAFT_1191064 [Mycena latifolia]|nr:hypothetical protein FB451DRAFT_1191064 [Mycena latifolia]
MPRARQISGSVPKRLPITVKETGLTTEPFLLPSTCDRAIHVRMATTTSIASSANDLLAAPSALILQVRTSKQNHRRQLCSLQFPPSEILGRGLPTSLATATAAIPRGLPPAKRARVTNYVPKEETTIPNSTSTAASGRRTGFLVPTLITALKSASQSLGCTHRANDSRASVNPNAIAPSYLPFAELAELHPAKFEVILLDPRPSPDVVWVRTNKTTNRGPGTDAPTSSLLARKHCLIGIRGTVRRSTDSWFVHCNVDTDVVFWEGAAVDPTRKPPDLYTLIENFCLGTPRLEVFGRARSSLRRGWVTALALQWAGWGARQGNDGWMGRSGAVRDEGAGAIRDGRAGSTGWRAFGMTGWPAHWAWAGYPAAWGWGWGWDRAAAVGRRGSNAPFLSLPNKTIKPQVSSYTMVLPAPPSHPRRHFEFIPNEANDCASTAAIANRCGLLALPCTPAFA